MCDYAFSEIECRIIKAQIERRAMYRKQFLKMRTDPCQHARQAGYAFDPALQRFMSMKCCQYEYFRPTPANAMLSTVLIVIPMLVYGGLLYTERNDRETKIRTGQLRYRDRLFKLS